LFSEEEWIAGASATKTNESKASGNCMNVIGVLQIGRSSMCTIRNLWLTLLASLVSAAIASSATAQQQKPNILVIMADDIGYWNISAYNRGMMG
jgi:hypothetical protein